MLEIQGSNPDPNPGTVVLTEHGMWETCQVPPTMADCRGNQKTSGLQGLKFMPKGPACGLLRSGDTFFSALWMPSTKKAGESETRSQARHIPWAAVRSWRRIRAGLGQ
jgi:hypothetical protein